MIGFLGARLKHGHGLPKRVLNLGKWRSIKIDSGENGAKGEPHLNIRQTL